MANELMKGWSTLSVVRKMQIKITLRYHYMPITMAKIEKTDDVGND